MNSNPEGILSYVCGVPVRTACFGTVAFNILFHGIWSSIDVYQFTKEEKAPDAYPDEFYKVDLYVRLPLFVSGFILLLGLILKNADCLQIYIMTNMIIMVVR